MTSLDFSYRGVVQTLRSGEWFGDPATTSFSDTHPTELQAIITKVEQGQPWRKVVSDHYAQSNPWLEKIVTAETRTLFFDQLVTQQPGKALDIGSGWGQTSRPLAEAGWQVTSLEPGRERLAFTKASATQDGLGDKITYLNADFLEIEFKHGFDLCMCIGVFEWVGAFQNQEDPLTRQRHFLKKVKSELVAGGSLVLGIENRLGLKYLLGCPDDHVGIPGVAFLPAALAARRWEEEQGGPLQSFTYTDAELSALLTEAGFESVELFAALPDYKLPQRVIPLADNGRAFNRGMLSGEFFHPEHNGYNGAGLSTREQEDLQATYASLAMQGIAHHFSPSFFVRAK